MLAYTFIMFVVRGPKWIGEPMWLMY